MKLSLFLLTFASSIFAAQCSWSDAWTWGSFRAVDRGSYVEITLKGSQLSDLSKLIDLTGDAWTIVGGVRFNMPKGLVTYDASCLPTQILEMNDSVLGTKRLTFTFAFFVEGENKVAHLKIIDVLDQKLIFHPGDCKE